MIHPNQLNHLTERNATLQKAWHAVIESHKTGNPTQINTATLRYLQVLQTVWDSTQVAVTSNQLPVTS